VEFSKTDRSETSSWPLRLITILLALFVLSTGFMKPSIDIAGNLITPSDLLFPFLFLSVAISVATGRARPRWDNIYVALVFYLAAMLVSCSFSVDPVRSLTKLVAKIYLVSLPIIILQVVRSEKTFRIVLLAWLIGAVIPVIIGIAALFLFYIDRTDPLLELFTYHYGAVPVGNYPRLSATFVSASMFCNYLNVTFFLLVIAREKRWIRRRLFIPALSAVLICAAFTISAGLGAVIASVAAYIAHLLSDRNKVLSRAILWAGVIGAVLLTALSFIELSPPATLTGPERGYFIPSPRVAVWQQAVATITQNPLTGNGLGLPVVNVAYRNAEGTGSLLTDAHNVFLNVAAESGLPGIAAIIAICIFVIAPVFRENRSWTVRNDQMWLIAAFIASFIVQGLTGSFEDARHLWVLIGLTVAAGRFHHETRPIC
jgi:putative inorganic carbon (hco3(-)) transporter